MAYDEGMAQTLRDDLDGMPLVEKRMFGGLCFMLDGNMLCGVHKGGAMFRVGKANDTLATAIPGVATMTMSGRAMPGFVTCDYEVCGDDARRARLLALATAFVKSLPPK